MKTINSILLALLIATFLWSCDYGSNEENESGTIHGTLINSSDCMTKKSTQLTGNTPDTLCCVNYIYDKTNKKLSITHVNAAFNCCPVEISCEFAMKGDTILINETEESNMCDCECLYDLDMLLEEVDEKIYRIKMKEPYIEPEDRLIIDIDLSNHTEGSYCVTRKDYPYGG
ncbi:MAG: hypothetical protein JXB49_21245 [Bacteroidales bacterium]|nr:hypothetical protein [Bacteroidales bacterium]